MLQVEHLSFGYGAQSILKDINLSIGQGEFVAVLGSNGAGKTTLFKCLLGLISPQQGMVTLDGDSIARMTYRQIAERMAYVPQEQPTNFNHHVIDIVEMSNQFISGEEALEQAYAALEQLGIAHLALRGYLEISGGQRQLVRIAQALMQATPYILMDEPTNNLDYGNQLRILDYCRQIVASGKTIIMTSHQPQDVLNFCDRAILIDQGQVLVDAEPQQALTAEHIHQLYGVEVELYAQIPHYPTMVLPQMMKE